MKTLVKYLLFLISAALFIEIFIFNFRHWESLTFPRPGSFDVVIGDGLLPLDDGNHFVADSSSAYVELCNIDSEVKNLKFNFFIENEPADNYIAMPIQIEATDAGNQIYFRLPITELVNGIDSSMYKRLYLTGRSSKLKINILNADNWIVHIGDIEINVIKPFSFRPVRFAFSLLLCLLFLLFRPSSPLYRSPLSWHSAKQRLLILSMLLLHIAVIFRISLTFQQAGWQNDTWQANLEYNYLAESLLEGHTWLNFTPPASLATMENPYDPALRYTVLTEAEQQSMLWDFAYYDGKYYCYFGIVPVLLFFIPYLLITGKWLYYGTLIMVVCAAFGAVSFWFLYTLIQKYYHRISVGIYLLLTSAFIFSCEFIYCLQTPGIYTVPISCGLLFNLLGLTFWLKAANADGQIRKGYLIAGATSIALTLGCRPQLAITLLFAFPIFYTEIRNRLFFSKAGLTNTLSVIIPFLIIGSALMYYNYIRFHSLLDFGATYNLTSHDMTNRGFLADRLYIGYFEYFFQPFHVTPQYPYLQAIGTSQLPTDFQGQVNNEPLLGGYLAFNPIGLLLFLLPAQKNVLRKKGLWSFSILSLLMSAVIAGIDIQMVGMTLRYLSEISLFVSLPVIISILTFTESISDQTNILYKGILTLIIILAGLTIILNIWSVFASGKYNELRWASRETYFWTKYVLFWR